MPLDPFTIVKVELWPVDVPLTDPFVVATGQRTVAENLFARVTLGSGAAGYGEMAPFPEVGGEDRTVCLETATRLANIVLGRSATQYRKLSEQFAETAPMQSASRCGLETAILDALCRELHIPLWGLWGGADVRPRETDITIPITTGEKSLALARHWYEQGFRMFKLKVGGDVEEDFRRMDTIHRTLQGIRFIVDANQGFTEDQCGRFVKEARRIGADLILLEQPVPRHDLESLAALRATVGVPIAVDESVRTLGDVSAVVRKKAADVVNIKITKSGVLQAMEMAAFARASGLRLMIGGMVETRIAMGCSFALVLGLGGFDFLDLDTPLLLVNDPVKGGYRYTGPTLHPWSGAGLDLQTEAPASVTTLE
jgi:L-alanine-DL-glutamate epimerase-like enolase superfamily enzyme